MKPVLLQVNQSLVWLKILLLIVIPIVFLAVVYIFTEGKRRDIIGVNAAVIFGILLFIFGAWGVLANANLFVFLAVEGGALLLAGALALTPEFHKK
jgi:hypothetical protein